MTDDTIIEAIRDAIAALPCRGTVRVYLFGSFARADACWSDVDVLIVTEIDSEGQLLREALSEICLLYPIDLQVMTTSEEAEFDFVRSEGCTELVIFAARPVAAESGIAEVGAWSQLPVADGRPLSPLHVSKLTDA